MKTIPVLINHDSTKPIGTMTIDETKLPPGDGYVFSLGYMVEKASRVGDDINIEKIELIEVSLQTDEQYVRYLATNARAPSIIGLAYDAMNHNVDVRFDAFLNVANRHHMDRTLRYSAAEIGGWKGTPVPAGFPQPHDFALANYEFANAETQRAWIIFNMAIMWATSTDPSVP